MSTDTLTQRVQALLAAIVRAHRGRKDTLDVRRLPDGRYTFSPLRDWRLQGYMQAREVIRHWPVLEWILVKAQWI